MNYSKTETLADYFSALDKRLEVLLPDRFSLLANIAGYTVRLIFPNMEYARYAVTDMFARPDNGMSVDATFIWWEDRIFPYRLHSFAHSKGFEQLSPSFCKIEDEYGYVEIVGDTLRAENSQKNNYYVLTYPSDHHLKWPVTVHPFVKNIFLWAQSRDLLILHAAAVGIDGHGVLLVGHGGAGKSTLACACLVEGFDFVSDDYCLLNATGSRIVFPVYTDVFLNPDSLEKLPMFKPFEILPMQSEKPSFTIGESRIKSSLSVEAIILPQITDNLEPVIKPDETSKALGQVVFSTVKQLGRFHETEFVRKLSQRLLGMPVYRFSLTKDLQKNCIYFKKWIREELSCTN